MAIVEVLCCGGVLGGVVSVWGVSVRAGWGACCTRDEPSPMK